MAVYFDTQVQNPIPGTNNRLTWHSNYGLVAVSSSTDSGWGAVSLFQEEGEHLAESTQTRACQVTEVAWHPTKRCVAMAWADGSVVVWNEQDKELYEAMRLHHGTVTVMAWSSAGSRLVTGDTGGLLVVWKADSRGRLQQNPFMQQALGDPFTQIVLKPPPPVDQNNDIASLARAAVSGDESALDMFNWKKTGGKGRGGSSIVPQEALTFFVGGKTGGVYYLGEAAKVVQAFSAEGAVLRMLYYEERNVLVTVTINMILSQHSVTEDGVCQELLKVKLSGRSQSPDMVWAGRGVLATATGENMVRMWDMEREENYILTLNGQQGYGQGELVTCVAYCQNKGVLAGGTGAGHVAMWRYSALASPKSEPEDRWKLQPPSTVPGAVLQLAWGSAKNLLGVNTAEHVYIFSEQVMCAAYCAQTAVVQAGPQTLAVNHFAPPAQYELKCDIQVKGITCSNSALAILDGKKVVVYEMGVDGVPARPAGTFSTESSLIALHEQNVYTVEPGKVQVRTFQGTVKQLLALTEAEGQPTCLAVTHHFLVVTTSNATVKVYDLSRREAKQHASPKHFSEVIPGLGAILSAACNCTGTRVSLLCTRTTGAPDSKLYVWDIELDTVTFFNLETGRGEQDEYLTQQASDQAELSEADKGAAQAAHDIAGRYPLSQHWDSGDPRLLACQAALMPGTQRPRPQIQNRVSLNKNTMEETAEVMVVSVFVTPETGALLQDSFPLAAAHNSLLGLDVPHFYFTKKADAAIDEANNSSLVARRVMRDFVGLELADKNARDAMLNFSFYLTLGNMDEAFKAIKLIKSESVWENMAKMCVKTRRMDVASVCLGNMGHARGAKALREASTEAELDARVAALAVQLGLQDDAERLLKNCQRYDLLNNLYQSSGHWAKAIETAETCDRVHLRTTYYNYAKHLEGKGDINAAIPNYEKSDTHRFEVPRMLFDEPSALEAYIKRTRDPVLRKWWAQYMESMGEMSTAIQYYEAAQDFLSLVRVYCYCADIDKAAEICNETGDRAACYRLAQQYENDDNIKQAIHFFTRAQAYGNAIRLCREHGMDDQLMQLALMGAPENMVEAARHYEERPQHQDKAVMLYHKAGHFSRALELAFRTKQFAALQMISEDLDERTDPALLQNCADFFLENGQHDRAVDLLAIAGKQWEALKLCAEQHVPLSEALVEKLTPAKDLPPDERNRVLEGIAEVAMTQRAYHIATKKYTQAGNKVKAMKALLKSGDTEKIVFFAGVSRQKEIYVMAANYLQSLDWRKDPEIMKNIISFYTKGRALDLLAGFYDACAQVEMDEYQNYEKAMGAMSEAYKCLSKAKMADAGQQEERLADLKHRMTLIKRFITARRLYEENSEESVKACHALLSEDGITDALRIGDVYAFIVEHCARHQQWKAAYQCMEELKTKIPKINLTFYINTHTLEAIYGALNLPFPHGVGAPSADMPPEEAGEDVVEEDVVDDFTDQMYN